VSGTARIVSWAAAAGAAGSEAAAWFLVLDLDPSWTDRVVPEGSIAVDGISMTVAEVTRASTPLQEGGLRVRISVIPYTRQVTTLAVKRTGDLVNIELDILASYVRAAMKAVLGGAGTITKEALRSWGYS